MRSLFRFLRTAEGPIADSLYRFSIIVLNECVRHEG